MKKLSEAIAELLKSLMEEKGQSPTQLAQKSRLAAKTVSNILAAKSEKFCLTTLNKILKGLCVTYEEFFQGELFALENLEDTRWDKE